jgi:ribosomal subunit interface protein
VQITISGRHGHLSPATQDKIAEKVEGDSVFAALDAVIDKMENQLRRFKERLKGRRATPHKHLEPPSPPEEA